MKKNLLYVFALIFSITAYPENKGFSRWSIVPEFGINKFDGDININETQIIPTSFSQLTYGANIEYALTPVWGFSLDYYYFPLKAKNSYNTIQINTDLYTSGFNLTSNLTRLFFPQTKSKIYLNGSIGLGYSYYSFNSAPPSLGVDLNHDNAFSIPITLSFEYNLSKAISLGSKVQYRAFNKDNLEGVSKLNFKGNSNDFVGAGSLFLRYKFHSIKKDHLRNVKLDDYATNEGLLLAKLNTDKINKLDKVISKLEDIINYQNGLLDSINIVLANNKYSPYLDNVPDMIDYEAKTPQNTPVNLRGKLLKINVDTSNSKKYIDDVPAVYFKYDKIELDDNALETISKIAIKMKADPSLYVEVRGYCDNVGNDKNNIFFSQRSTNRVKEELVNYWKIPGNHIITTEKRYENETQLKYRLTRRCDFFFVKL